MPSLNRIAIAVPDIDAVLTSYTHIRMYRRASRTAPPSEIVGPGLPIPLVAKQTEYEYVDANGLPTDWYEYSYLNQSTGQESAHSEPLPANQTTLYDRRTLVRMLAARLSAFGLPDGNYTFPGPSGTTTAAGAADGTTVVCADYQSTGLAEDAYKDWFLFLPTATGALAAQARRVVALAGASGTFTLGRPFPAQVPQGTAFDLYAYAPPAWWEDCLFGEHTGAYQDVWVPFQYHVAGPPSGTIPGGVLRHVPLPGWVERAVQVQRVRMRLAGDPRAAVLTLGPEYEVHELPTGVELYVPAGLGPNQVLLVDGYRQCPRLVSDSETLQLTTSQLGLLLCSGAVQALRQLASGVVGLEEDRRRWQLLLGQYEAERRTRTAEVGNWRMQAGLRPDLLLSLGPEVV